MDNVVLDRVSKFLVGENLTKLTRAATNGSERASRILILMQRWSSLDWSSPAKPYFLIAVDNAILDYVVEEFK